MSKYCEVCGVELRGATGIEPRICLGCWKESVISMAEDDLRREEANRELSNQALVEDE